MIILIKVTGEHIRAGHGGDCSSCPIALAIREQTIFKSVEVTNVKVYKDQTHNANDVWLCKLPVEAQEFIVNFDRDMGVCPFTFELEIDNKYFPQFRTSHKRRQEDKK